MTYRERLESQNGLAGSCPQVFALCEELIEELDAERIASITIIREQIGELNRLRERIEKREESIQYMENLTTKENDNESSRT